MLVVWFNCQQIYHMFSLVLQVVNRYLNFWYFIPIIKGFWIIWTNYTSMCKTFIMPSKIDWDVSCSVILFDRGIDRSGVSLPSHRWTNGWQTLKNIITNGWMTEKPIEKSLVPMVEQVPFHLWQWSPLIFGNGSKLSAFIYSRGRYQTNQWQFLEN